MSFEKSFSHEEDILEGVGSKDVRNYKTLNGKSNTNENFSYNEIKDSQNSDKNEKKIGFVTYKYSQMGKGELYEAAIVNDIPFFIMYNNITNEVELVETIEENRRILRPPEIE